MNGTRCTLGAAVVAAAILSPASAQSQDIGTILGKVLGAVVGVDANYYAARPVTTRGTTAGTRDFGLHGLGVEALIDLTPTPPCKPLPRPETRPPQPRPAGSRPATDTVTVDTTLTEIRVRRPGRDGADTTAIYAVSRSCNRKSRFDVELGIDYSLISGFRGDSSARGAVEDKPSISLYVAPSWARGRITPYFGFTGGLSDLKDFRVTQNGHTYNASGTTWHFGAGAGLSFLPFPSTQTRIAVFAGFEWTYRGFRDATWSLAANDTAAAAAAIPPGPLPDIDLSTYSVTVGVQIRLGSGKDSTSVK